MCCALGVGQLNQCHKLLSEEDLEFHPQQERETTRRRENVIFSMSDYKSIWVTEDNFNLNQTQACLINLLL